MLNRAVLILRYKQPFVDWINAADPTPTQELTLVDVNDDNTAYLIEVEERKRVRAMAQGKRRNALRG